MNKKLGFSLAEMSIVLVILGLLAGAVVAGKGLIAGASRNKLIQEFSDFSAAYKLFSDKYKQLPGDFPFATTPPGGSTPAAPAPFYSASTDTGDGNGDRKIIWSTAGAIDNEGIMAWQHLQLEGMIQGSFTGSISGTIKQNMSLASIGGNIPISKSDKMIGFAFDNNNDNNTTYPLGNHIQVGSADASGINDAVAFSPVDAWAIDEKMDDGMPGNGLLQARTDAGAINATCATGASLPVSTYTKTNNTTKGCILQYRLD